jgi:hypothetical protein
MTVEEAGKELEEHIINDGDLTEISNAFYNEIKSSGFFQKLLEKMQAAVEKQEAPKKVQRRKK